MNGLAAIGRFARSLRRLYCVKRFDSRWFSLPVLAIATGVAGYGREAIFAAAFGRTALADSFYLAYAVVQTISDLAFVGALSATIVPLLSGADDGEEASRRRAEVFATAATVVLVGGLALAAALVLAVATVVPSAALPLGPDRRAPVFSLIRQLAWLIPLNAGLALLYQALMARGRFVSAALPYLGNHLFFSAAILISGSSGGEAGIVAASYAGPIAGLVWLASRVHAAKLWNPHHHPTFAGLVALARLWWPTTLTLGVGSSIGMLMTAQLILRLTAAPYGQGAIAAIAYAYRLYQGPISIFAAPTAALIFTSVAAFRERNDVDTIRRQLMRVLVIGGILFIPIALVLFLVPEPIVDLFFRRGHFDQDAVRSTAAALKGFALAVPFEAWLVILIRVYQGLHRPGTAATGALAVPLLLGVLVTGFSADGLFGLALEYSAACSLICCVLTAVLYTRLRPLPARLPSVER